MVINFVLICSSILYGFYLGIIPSSFCNLKLTEMNLDGNSFECYPHCLSEYFRNQFNIDSSYSKGLTECNYDFNSEFKGNHFVLQFIMKNVIYDLY